ncbi:hypothetical protein Lser_V15G21555 [Lactuca serriola]
MAFGKGEVKVKWVNDLIQKHNLAVVGIQETKRKHMSEMLIRKLWGSSDFEFLSIDSQGNGGGLLSIWNNSLFSKDTVLCSEDCLIFTGKTLLWSAPFKFFNSWLEEEDLENLVIDVWKNFKIDGRHCKLFLIMQKLKVVKSKIKAQAMEYKRKEEGDRNVWRRRIKEIDKIVEEDHHSIDIMAERLDLVSKIRWKD